MTPAEKDRVAADIARQLDTYLDSDEFAARAETACRLIEVGIVPTNAELAELLGLPERFVAVALDKQAAKFSALRGALQ
jgi:alkylated DNA nucleotide flippase Atl1